MPTLAQLDWARPAYAMRLLHAQPAAKPDRRTPQQRLADAARERAQRKAALATRLWSA